MVATSEIAPGLLNRWRDARYTPSQQRLVAAALDHIDYSILKKSYHVTLIIKRNKIITYGVNKELKTHTVANHHNYWNNKIHSELDAALKIWGALKGYDILNIRVDKHRNICMARPCKRCLDMLRGRGVNRVHYTDNDGFIVTEDI